ncbi:MAG: hypothetical protein R3255_07345 [Candidatus Lokiarchaeia archaeon]|nr:hypothetical protein [Candidatus Lokiarchaeia archaeon]
MTKIFVCRECGYVFPQELSHLIESNIQVYCERCGSPFILEGVEFKPAPTPYIRQKKPYHTIPEIKSSSLDKFIQVLNKISSLPLFIFFFYLLIAIIVPQFPFFGSYNLFDIIVRIIICFFLIFYDRMHLNKKIKEKNYNEIALDAFCWGILGCIMYGLGVIILIKGIFIIIYILSSSQNKDFKAYNYGLLAKNSLNYFSNKAGYIIILYSLYRAFSEGIYLPEGGGVLISFPFGIQIPLGVIIYFILLIIAVIMLLIDGGMKKGIKEKQKFAPIDGIKFMIIGILGTMFFAAGIFVLLKGILIVILSFGKPSEKAQIIIDVEKPRISVPTPPIPPTPPVPPEPYRKLEEPRIVTAEEEDIELKIVKEPVEIQEPETIEKEKIEIEQEKMEEIPSKEIEEIPPKLDKEEKAKREEEYKLKLHDSLLPVKDEKDKKLVKEYFSKIFAVLSKDLRKQINDLKITKKEKKELLEELAFLTNEEQVKYIEAIVNLYKEIPKRLINRIRKLPNVKPSHYDKIVEELKYMDYEEQVRFVQFLEENA